MKAMQKKKNNTKISSISASRNVTVSGDIISNYLY